MARCRKGHRSAPHWIWHRPGWPAFTWDATAVAGRLRERQQVQDQLLGMAGAATGEQVKVLNRMLDGGERGFEHGISAAQYQSAAKVSKATATRHLADLLRKGCMHRLPGGGRSTRYVVDIPASDIALPERLARGSAT
ncbi:DUF4172 domain-containing protein [Stenotrophomonas sp. S39]|nr:DUF4172 domain-containing protein [Stenotrophomonas sp. S39]